MRKIKSHVIRVVIRDILTDKYESIKQVVPIIYY